LEDNVWEGLERVQALNSIADGGVIFQSELQISYMEEEFI